jgi:2-polyprenyl-3-methyl-5-hydroxy-6-metoxy-1,4-benzoquinol methylase
MWNERYSESGFAYGTAPNDFLVAERARLPQKGSCLALADGEGRNGVWLATEGLTVTAVDLSSVGLEKAQQLADEAGVPLTTEVADLATYDLGVATWDSIVSIWAHVPEALRQSLHERVVQALRPGGVFLLEAYTPAQIPLGTGGPKDPSMLMTLAKLRAELTGLVVEVGTERERHVDEGRYHQGNSAVVQLVARKPSA